MLISISESSSEGRNRFFFTWALHCLAAFSCGTHAGPRVTILQQAQGGHRCSARSATVPHANNASQSRAPSIRQSLQARPAAWPKCAECAQDARSTVCKCSLSRETASCICKHSTAPESSAGRCGWAFARHYAGASESQRTHPVMVSVSSRSSSDWASTRAANSLSCARWIDTRSASCAWRIWLSRARCLRVQGIKRSAHAQRSSSHNLNWWCTSVHAHASGTSPISTAASTPSDAGIHQSFNGLGCAGCCGRHALQRAR